MKEKFIRHLRRAGCSLTAQRLTVFEHLTESGPLTVDSLIKSCSSVDQASVYRALGLFRRLGVIEDVVVGGRRMVELTDEFDVHHHHLTCTSCGRTITLASANLEKMIEALAEGNGFKATSHAVEISGLCRGCQTG